jgi:catechol 2,3-dioxygenase-like lactoylglutathione lyase family enzyme
LSLAGADLIAFVSTSDAARARAFYGELLGLRLVEESPFALVFDAGGTMLRVTAVQHVEPASYTVLGWAVPEIASAVDALSARGVQFSRFDSVEQDERGVWSSPAGASVAWFADPDGNTLSLTQF